MIITFSFEIAKNNVVFQRNGPKIQDKQPESSTNTFLGPLTHYLLAVKNISYTKIQSQGFKNIVLNLLNRFYCILIHVPKTFYRYYELKFRFTAHFTVVILGYLSTKENN